MKKGSLVIVHVCQLLGMGGLEKVLLSLALEQQKMGHKVKILVYDRDKRWVPLFRENGVEVVDDRIKSPGYDLKTLRWILKNIGNADIVHTHDLNPALYIAPLKVFGLLKGKRFCHTTHGMEDLKSLKIRLFENLAAVCADALACVGPSFADFYRSRLGIRKNKIQIIPNGVRPAPLKRDSREKARTMICSEFNLSPDLPLAVFVGRIGPNKGQLDLIRFYNEHEHQLLLIGPPANESYYRECRDSLSKNTAMSGPREDVSFLLSGCDYFVSPSKHEGMPISALEAGLAGLPCILSDIPGHRQFNQDRDCVVLYASESELKAALAGIKSLEQKVKNFKSLIQTSHSSRSMALVYENLYAGDKALPEAQTQ